MSERARPGLPRVGLPVRDAGRDRRVAPGAGRRRRRVLLPPHDDARPGPAPAVGRRDHPERRVPADRRSGAPPAEPRGGDDRAASRCWASRSGAATRRSCTTRRSPRPGSTPGTCCGSWSPTRSRPRSRRRGPTTGSGLGVTAPYKRVVAGLCDESRSPSADRIGAVNNVIQDATRAGSSGSTATRAGFRAGVELAMGPDARGRRGRRRGGGRRRARGRLHAASRRGRGP